MTRRTDHTNKPPASGPASPGRSATTPRTGPAAQPTTVLAAIREQPNVERTVTAFRSAAANVYSSPLPQMAAALSFRTVFSLVPVLVVSLVVLSTFVREEQVTKVLSQFLDFAGISQIQIEQRPTVSTGLAGVPMMEIPGLQTAEEKQAKSAELEEVVRQVVLRTRESQRISLNLIGLVGIGVLFYAAISMLVEVERAFNVIYRVPTGRSWVRRIMQYWTLLTLGAIGLIATFAIGEQFKAWIAQTAGNFGVLSSQAVALVIAGYIVTVAISTGLLWFAYVAVPNTRVHLRAALVGAFVAAILWELGKWGFTQYLRYSATYEKMYGSLALIPLLLLWIYATWVIVLLGLQIAHKLQTPRVADAEPLRNPPEPVVIDPMMIVPVLAEVGRAFRAGSLVDEAHIAARTGVTEPIAREFLAVLQTAHVIHPALKDGEPGYFTLARPPEDIPLSEIIALAMKDSENRVTVDHAPIIHRLHGVCIESVKGRTLGTLLTGAPTTSAPGPQQNTPAAPAAPDQRPPSSQPSPA